MTLTRDDRCWLDAVVQSRAEVETTRVNQVDSSTWRASAYHYSAVPGVVGTEGT